MLKKSGNYVTPVLVSVVFFALTVSSCKKTGPTDATIYVIDSAGRKVGGVNVTLWQDTSYSTQTGHQSTIRVSKPTDASGRADFEFSLEAYLNVQAIRDSDTAKGFIRLKEHETVDKTVQLHH